MAVAAGRYRKRIRIMKDSGERDDTGASTGNNVEIAFPWCKATPMADVEISDERTVGQQLTEFEIRYSKSLENPTSDMFIEYKNTEYDIISVLNFLDLNEKLKIMAKVR